MVTGADITYPGGFTTRIRSELAILRELGVATDLLVVLGARPWCRIRRSRPLFELAKGLCRSVRVWLAPPHANRVSLSGIRRAYLAARVLRWCRARGVRLVHLHGPDSGSLGAHLVGGGLEVLFEPHGILPEEQLMLGHTATIDLARDQDGRAAQGASRLLVVSSRMREHYHGTYGVPTECIHVLPSVVDLRWAGAADNADRMKARGALGLRDGPVLLYLGSLHMWQEIDTTARLCAEVTRRRSDAQVLVLADGSERRLRSVFSVAGVPSERIVVRGLPHKRVPELAIAADVGFLLRRPNIVNEVASPVKFAEYLALGIPVVTTPHVGDCGEIVHRHKVGLVTDPWRDANVGGDLDSLLTAVLADREGMGERCRAVAREHLSWQAGGVRLLEALGIASL